MRYTVTDDNALQIDYHATLDKPCPVNLTNHGYFHPDGANSDVRQQRLQIMANDYLPVDSEGIPCANPTDVGNTGMDFRQPKTIATDFLRDHDQQRMKGYDHGYLLYPGLSSAEDPAARLLAPAVGRLRFADPLPVPGIINGLPMRFIPVVGALAVVA